MKIKGVIKNLKIKKFKLKNDNSKIYPGISLELLKAVWVSSVSDSSLFQLVLVLKVDRPPPLHSQY